MVLDALTPIFDHAAPPKMAAPADLRLAAARLCDLTAASDVLWQALSSSGTPPASLKTPQFWQPLRDADELARMIATMLEQ